MKRLSGILFISLFAALPFFPGCTSKKVTPEEATKWLTGAKEWKLSEITVNGKPTYKSGQVIEQFGEISFDRFMEKVSFMTSGQFVGSFPDSQKLTLLNWVAGSDAVTVSDTVPNSGTWQIPYQSLTEKSFEMTTESTAYDPPRPTRIVLKFER